VSILDIREAKRIVIKVGTSTLTHSTGRLNLRRIEHLTRVLSGLKNMDKEIILVSSGAVGVGMAKLDMAARPKETREKQAAAAVGQCELMGIYGRLFAEYGYKVAQILMTRDVLDHAEREKNVVGTIDTLLSYGAIPIFNENDPVSSYELEFGDNDTLSAATAVVSRADVLIILSDIDGLYDSDPRYSDEARLIRTVKEITPEIVEMAGGSGSSLGTGGMTTKINAARIATEKGIDVIITNGDRPEILYDILEGKPIGTRFLGQDVKA